MPVWVVPLPGFAAGPPERRRTAGLERHIFANGTMKDEPRPVHEHEHATPTVIHDPEEDMTILARWLQRGMEQGPKFWLLLIGSAVALLVVASLLGGLSMGTSANGQAWIDLIPAKTAEDQLKVARTHPNTPVADWARLQAAFEEYRSGLEALTDPKQRDLLAKTRLDKALELFRQVAKDAPKESPQSRGAAFGVARTLEARNDLAEAIKQYQFVVKAYPDSPEAKQSAGLAIRDPRDAGTGEDPGRERRPLRPRRPVPQEVVLARPQGPRRPRPAALDDPAARGHPRAGEIVGLAPTRLAQGRTADRSVQPPEVIRTPEGRPPEGDRPSGGFWRGKATQRVCGGRGRGVTCSRRRHRRSCRRRSSRAGFQGRPSGGSG